jgi:predicted ATPase/transcriptional regulator with XRE-family HTH domain
MVDKKGYIQREGAMDRMISFGYWIRRRRKALDLTQDALARQAGYATATIKKIEADERRPSRELAERLAELLKITPEDRITFLGMARAERAPDGLPLTDPVAVSPRTTVTAHAHNLPAPLTTLIGREHETASICTLLRRADVRLVTLTGPGGIGKTRLALNVTTALRDEVANGVHVVSLAPISDPALVIIAIAQVLALHERDTRAPLRRLQDYLRDKQLVLLLDNFEQVVDAAPLVAELLAAAPQLTVLITSRMLLRLSGEHEVAVPPLALPDRAHAVDPDRLIECAAVRLFVARAQAARSDFALTRTNAPAIAAICQRLDGLPLAIELAAARIKLFSPQALLARLSSPLGLLTVGARDQPPRQQTLRATLDWSYNLLDADEQSLFARLAVFVGGCTLEAVEAVCGDCRLQIADCRLEQSDQSTIYNLQSAIGTGNVLDTLSRLVDQSLVQQELPGDGAPHFTMLGTIREYALERLELSGEAEALRRRHATYYLALAEAAEPELRGPQQKTWLERLEQEHDNLRAAMAWSQTMDDGAELGLRLSAALRWFWYVRGYMSEGRRWLDAALERSSVMAATVRAKALYAAGYLAAQQQDFGHATALSEASLVIFQELGDRHGIANAFRSLGIIATFQHDLARADELHQESLRLYQALGDEEGIATELFNLGQIMCDRGDFAPARALLSESLALSRKRGDTNGIALDITALGLVAYLQGDYAQAAASYEESLAMFRKLEHKGWMAACLYGLGGVVHFQGDDVQARVLYLESLSLAREVGAKQTIAYVLVRLAILAGAQAQFARTVRLCGAVEGMDYAHLDYAHYDLSPDQRAEYDHYLAAARAQLDAATFAAAWADGRTLTIEQASAYALATDAASPEPLNC